MAVYHLTAPLKDEDVEKLKIGDTVYISGKVFTCRSRLQKYIFDEKNTLPFKTDDRNVLIHNGPIVVKENGEKIAHHIRGHIQWAPAGKFQNKIQQYDGKTDQ